MMTGCAEQSVLQLKPDGTLRAAGVPNLCVVAGPAGGPQLAVGGKDCIIFSKLGADGTLRSGPNCLASKNGVLILDSCSSAVDGDESPSAIKWTTTDSITGSYIEQASKAPIQIELSQGGGHRDTLDIEFVPGMQHYYHSSQVGGRRILLPHASVSVGTRTVIVNMCGVSTAQMLDLNFAFVFSTRNCMEDGTLRPVR